MLAALKRLVFGDPLAPLREQVERDRLLAEQRAIRATEGLFDVVDPREPYTDDGSDWYPIGGENVPRNVDSRRRGEVLPVYLTENGLKAIRDRSRELCAYSGTAINAKENRVNYAIGKGLAYKLVPRATACCEVGEEQPSADVLAAWCRQGQAVIDDYLAGNNWAARERETFVRGDEDGEGLVRLFHRGGGRTEARFTEPEHLRSPAGGMLSDDNLGVRTAPNDVEDVAGYWICDRPADSLTPSLVDADEVCHLKFNVRSTSKRGYPTFWPVRDHLERADKLLRNLSILAAVRTAYAVIIKRKHSRSSIEGHAAGKAEQTITDPVTGTVRRFARRLPGGVLETDALSEYEFPGANLSSGDYLLVYQAELRAIAARLNMPEYMLTADASNNNFASILVAESPSSKNFEALQASVFAFFGNGVYVGPRKSGVLWKVLRNAVEYGTLPDGVLRHCEIQIDGPVVVVKDKYQETDRAHTLSEKGLLSDKTWSAQEGLDYDREQANRLQEAEARRAAKEREEKTDKQALIDLQRSYYARQIPREAAVATAQVVFSYSAEDADRLFPRVEMPVPLTPGAGK